MDEKLTQFRDALFAEELWEELRQDIGISPTQMRVARAQCMGQSIKQIALAMGRSNKTAEAHRLRIAQRLDLDGTAEFVSMLLMRAFLKYIERRAQVGEWII